MKMHEAHARLMARRFFRVLGRDTLDRRAESIIKRCEDSAILAEYLRDQYALEVGLYALAALLEDGGAVGAEDALAMHRAFHFTTAFMLTRRKLHVSQRNMLDRRIAGLISDEQGLAPLEHELITAIHLMNDGFDVEPAEAKGLRCDWIARKLGFEFEVECKHISKEKGRRIRSHAFLTLASLIEKLSAPNGIAPETCLRVAFTCDSELPKDPMTLQRIANAWHSSIATGAVEGSVDGVSWITSHAEIPVHNTSSPKLRKNWLKSLYEKDSALFNIFSVIMVDETRSMMISARSNRADNLIAGTEKELLESCKRQFTGQRPGILYVRFAGLSQFGLDKILHADRTGATALKRMANKILDRRRHIHTISFPTVSSLDADSRSIELETKTVSHLSGKAYSFKNGKCSFSEAMEVSLFREPRSADHAELP